MFYKVLEAIITLEHNPTSKPLNNFSVSLRQEQFQRSLFASCLEIVMLSYNSKETLFPWILQVFGLKAYDYYRIIEPVIRSEQQLSRDVVKHFNRVCAWIYFLQSSVDEFLFQSSAQQHMKSRSVVSAITGMCVHRLKNRSWRVSRGGRTLRCGNSSTRSRYLRHNRCFCRANCR